MKILFSDLDGTLLHQNESISDINIQKMKELKEQGHLIALCTGRNIMETKHVVEHIDLPFDYLVLNNGGHILNDRYETLYEKKIDHLVGVDILDHTTKYAGMWSYFCDGIINYGYKDGITIDHGDYKQPIIDQDFHQVYHDVDHFQIIAFNQDNEEIDDAKKCYDYIVDNYGDQVEAYFNTHYVDVVPQGCSKGTGVKTLLSLLDQDIDEVYAIGDSFNDVSMIKEADHGYTFYHSEDDIKKHTDHYVHYVHELIDDMLGE